MKTIYFLFSLLTLTACFHEQSITPIQDTKEDVMDFVKGFLDGMGATRIYLDIQTCITDSETFLIDVATGIRDIQTEQPEKVKEGIRLLGQASKLITRASQECKLADAEVIKIIRLIRTFTNPVSFIYHAEKSLIINRIEVFKEIFNALIAYENQNYEELGYWVGKAMNSIFVKSSKGLTDTKSDIIDFAVGFLQGVGATEVFNQIKDCIVDSEQFLIDVGVGIQDIQTKQPEKVREGIHILGEAAKIIPEAALACKAAETDVQRIVQLIQSFTNPTSFAYHVGKSILINRVEVFNEVMHAIIAYQQQDFKSLGYWVGEAMASIFLKSQIQSVIPTNSTEILDFAEGFLEGVGSAAAFDQIRECIDDSETVVSDLVDGVEDIKTKNPAKVKEGIQLIGQAVQVIPNAVELCKAGEVDLKTLIKMVETFKSPISFLYYVGKSLIINHVEVFDEVNSAVQGYDAKNYTQLGYWVGKAMDTILLGQDVLSNEGVIVNDSDGSRWEVVALRRIEN